MIRRVSLFVLLFLGCSVGLVRATAYTTTPDTVVFTPTGQGTMTSYVRVAYLGDTSKPGDHIRATITSGSSYFSISVDSIFTKSYYYWTITYTIQSSLVWGSITFTDDTTTRVVVLKGNAGPDGYISGYGPYYPSNVPPGGSNCQNLRMINTGLDNDTITSASWSHSTGGLFIWDSSLTFPHVLHSHDTLNWNICWHAGTDTSVHTDTLAVYYSDAYSHTRYFTRIVTAQAHDTTSPDGVLSSYGPYYSNVPKNGTSCVALRMINTGADVDTLVSATWSHSNGGMFVWDSTLSFPHVMHSHDTLEWHICFHAPNDTLVYMDTITVRYHDAYSQTRYFTRVVYGRAIDTTTPDGYLWGIGPYFTATVPEGATNCTHLEMINTGADVDTIVSVAWSHDPSGIFTQDTSFSVPAILHSHDTMYVGFCFHAPNDTLRHWDTLIVHYHDAYSQSRYFTRIVSGQATDTNIINCYSLYPTSVPFTEVGDTSRFRVFVHNLLGSSASLTGLHFSGSADASFLVDSSTFPHTIAAHAYDSVWLEFIPQASTSSTYSATLTGTFTTSDTAHCHTAYTTVTGTAAQASRDTATVSLSDTSTQHIAMVSDTSVYYYSHRVNIVNNIGVRIRIDTVYLTNTNHIYIAQQIRSHFPDTLVDGAKHSVIIHFYGDTSHTVYHDTLVVTMENAAASYYFYVDGYSQPAKSDVLTITRSTATDLRIYPNPSTGLTNFLPVGLASVKYEILDVLGNLVAQHTGSSAWQWNPGTDGADGTYFIRVSGQDADGRTVVVSRRFLLQR